MDMERKNNNDAASSPSLLGEIFAATSNGHKNSIRQAQAIGQLHARLSSSDFVDQMTNIFYRAKCAALTSSKSL